jgi:hypothetical protein
MPDAERGTSVIVMATTPTKATARNSPDMMRRGFQRTVIGRYSFGSKLV